MKGATKICVQEPPKKPFQTNPIGRKFNGLTVTSYFGKYGNNNVWNCKCSCGNNRLCTTSEIMKGAIKSCGCKWKNWSETHSMTRTRIYRIWCVMKSRCNNPKVPNYRNYGGRGIKVCEKWNTSFDAFYKDMSEGYADDLSIDRINNDGDYEPSNCKWSTKYEQSRNRRTNVWYEIGGERLTVKDWAARLGIHHTSINQKMRNGHSFENIYNHYMSNPNRNARIKKQ